MKKLEDKLVPKGPGITRYLALPKSGWTDEQVKAELQKSVALHKPSQLVWYESSIDLSSSRHLDCLKCNMPSGRREEFPERSIMAGMSFLTYNQKHIGCSPSVTPSTHAPSLAYERWKQKSSQWCWICTMRHPPQEELLQVEGRNLF